LIERPIPILGRGVGIGKTTEEGDERHVGDAADLDEVGVAGVVEDQAVGEVGQAKNELLLLTPISPSARSPGFPSQ
jgi:hypothetical protein